MTATGAHAPERLVVGIDGSLCSHAAVRWALTHARPGDTIALVHAWEASPSMVDAGLVDPTDDDAARIFAHRELARARSLPNPEAIEISCDIVHGDAGDCLSNQPADLLIVGARGHGGLTSVLLGSVSTHLAHRCPVPLVIVPCPAHPTSPPTAP